MPPVFFLRCSYNLVDRRFLILGDHKLSAAIISTIKVIIQSHKMKARHDSPF